MDIHDTVIKVKKFVLDNAIERDEYLEILNDPDCTKIDEKFTYDKMKNNTPITTLWWREPK